MKQKTALIIVLLTASWLTAQHAAAQDDTNDLRQEVEEIRNDLNRIQDRLKKSVEIHGFVSQGYLRSCDNNYWGETDEGTFEFNEIGLNISTNLSDQLRLGLQIFSHDLGDYGDNELEIDWAYADYYYRDWLSLRVGRTKTPVGLYGETRDFDVVNTFVILPQSMYIESFRESTVAVNGAAFYGNLPLVGAGHLDYTTWIGGVRVSSDNAGVRPYEDIGPGFFEITDAQAEYTTGINLRWETPLPNLLLTGTFLRVYDVNLEGETTATMQAVYGVPTGSPMSAHADRVDSSSFGMELSLGRFIFASEYINFRGKTYVTAPALGTFPISLYSEGYYWSLTYALSRKLSLGAYYNVYYNDAADKDGSDLEAQGRREWEGFQKDLAFAIRYDVNENWALKAEFHTIEGVGQLYRIDNPDGFDKEWHMLALKVTYSF